MKWASPHPLLSFPVFGLCSSYRVEDTRSVGSVLSPEPRGELGAWVSSQVCGLGVCLRRSLSLCYYTQGWMGVVLESAEPRSWCRDKCSMSSNHDSFFLLRFFFKMLTIFCLYSICYNIALSPHFGCLALRRVESWLSNLGSSVDWTHTPALKVLQPLDHQEVLTNHCILTKANGLHPTSCLNASWTPFQTSVPSSNFPSSSSGPHYLSLNQPCAPPSNLTSETPFQILESSGLFAPREQQQLLFPLPELFFSSLSSSWLPPTLQSLPRCDLLQFQIWVRAPACALPSQGSALPHACTCQAMLGYHVLRQCCWWLQTYSNKP